jgi:hypothetical protein
MTYLVKLLEQCERVEYTADDSKLKEKIILPILRSFIHLCVTP